MVTKKVNIKIVSHETRNNTAYECIPHENKCSPNIEKFKIVITAGHKKDLILYK